MTALQRLIDDLMWTFIFRARAIQILETTELPDNAAALAEAALAEAEAEILQRAGG